MSGRASAKKGLGRFVDWLRDHPIVQLIILLGALTGVLVPVWRWIFPPPPQKESGDLLELMVEKAPQPFEALISFRVKTTGFQEEELSVRAFLHEATKEEPSVEGFLEDRMLRPDAVEDEQRLEMRLPVPQRAGVYLAKIKLFDPLGEELDRGSTPKFDVGPEGKPVPQRGLHIVDTSIDEMLDKRAVVLDVKIRNVDDEPAFLKRAVFDVQEVAPMTRKAPGPTAGMVPPVANYDVLIPIRAAPYSVEHAISQDIGPKGTDEFTFTLGLEKPTSEAIAMVLSLRLVYNEDDREARRRGLEVLFGDPADVAPTKANVESLNKIARDDPEKSPNVKALIKRLGVPGAPLSVPASVDFGASPVGVGISKEVIVSNKGTGTLKIIALEFSGAHDSDFEINSTSCEGAALAGGASCKISIQFAPEGASARSAALTIAHSLQGSPARIALMGIGSPPVKIAVQCPGAAACPTPPGALSFSGWPAHTCPQTPLPRPPRADTKTITVTNVGTPAATIAGFALMPGGGSPFRISSGSTTCRPASSIPPGGGCQISVTFAPSSMGVFSATLDVRAEGSATPLVVALAGKSAPAC